MNTGAHPSITVSVVSHHQGALIHSILLDLQQHCAHLIEVVLTLNVEENLPFDCADFTFPIAVRRNCKPKGFGANHNAAFPLRKGHYFCVMNPDVTLKGNPFEVMIDCCHDDRTGVVAPLVINTKGTVEKSGGRFPTPYSILAKLFGFDPPMDYTPGKECFFTDWIAGMFMFFPACTYEKVNGFDERYFLYYEDVDICARLCLAGYRVVLCPAVSIIHDARRESHRNAQYLKWHLSSMTRFFLRMLHWRLTGKRLVVE